MRHDRARLPRHARSSPPSTSRWACIHASHAVSYAEIGNDAGLEFAVRSAALYFRAAIDTVKQLKAEKAAKAVEEEFT